MSATDTQTAPSAPAPLIAPTGDVTLDVLGNDLNQAVAPFQKLSLPDATPLDQANDIVSGILGVAQVGETLLNDGFAMATAGIAKLFPGMPAATLLTLHLGFPHLHIHPPAMPIPLPSFGPVLLSGCVSVLINGIPAIRAGDIGISVTCGTFAPPFEVFTGSSSVFIGGARAARMLDITKHCQPGAAATKAASLIQKVGETAMGVAAIGSEVLGAVTTEVDADRKEDNATAADPDKAEEAEVEAAAAAAGHQQAAMMAAQAGLDAAAMALGMLMGMDPGTPPCYGALLFGMPNVEIGGFPMPPWGAVASGLAKLGKGLKRKKNRKKSANHKCDAEGHPIDPVTGNNFDDFVDYEDPASPLEFRWVRHYSSADAQRKGPLGRGFRHGYERSLAVDLDRAVYTDDHGQTVEFVLAGGNQGRAARDGYVLRVDAVDDTLTYTITRAGEPAMEFVRERQTVPRLARLRTEAARLDFLYSPGNRLTGMIEVSADRSVETQLVFDPEGHLVQVRRGMTGRELSLVVAYGYDHAGCLTVWQDVLGAKGRYEYDEGRRLTRMTDRNGYSFHFRYDELGRCIQARGDNELWAVALRYEPENRRTFATRANGGVWCHEYDENGTIVCVTDPYGGQQLRIVDDEGKVVREVGPDGQTNLQFRYDDSGHHYAVEDRFGYLHPPLDENPNPPNPLALRVVATAWQRQWGTALPLSPLPARARTVPALQRDQLGRVTKRVDAFGHHEAWAYDANGNEIRYIDRDGREHRSVITAWNLLGAELDPLGHCTRYGYTAHEDVALVVDPGGSESRYEYDLSDRLVKVLRHGVVREEYVYDTGGRLIEKRAGAGDVLLQVVPGTNGLPQERRLASGELYRYAYDSHGHVTSTASGDDEVRRVFDGRGRLLSDERSGGGVKHRFAGAELGQTTYFGRFVVTYHREPDGTLVITAPVGGTQRLQQDSDGQSSVQLGNGTRVWSSYDEQGRCQKREVWQARDGAHGRWTVEYTYSAAGELHRSADNVQGVTTYQYDAAHRLIGECSADGQTTKIVLDAAGNVREKPGLAAVVLDEGNRLQAAGREHFRYDTRNHLSAILGDDREGTHYRYDSLDMLVGVTTTGQDAAWSSGYDGLRRRTFKAYGDQRTEFFWDEHRLAAEVGPSGTVRIYVYPGPEALVPILFIDYADVAADPESGQIYYPMGNQLGVPQHIENQAGDIVWKAERIEPYGAVTVAPGASITYALRFPGHYLDGETGLHYNRFRYYSPRLGRYLQCDPVGQAGGINLYAYPANPLVDVDVLGLNHNGKRKHVADGTEESPDKPRVLRQRTQQERPKLDKDTEKLLDDRSDIEILRRHLEDIELSRTKAQERMDADGSNQKARITEATGERAATGHMLQLKPPYEMVLGYKSGTGFDQVWVRSDGTRVTEYCIVEAKGQGAKLGETQNKGPQMSRQWVEATLDEMQHANRTLQERELAQNIQRALDEGEPPVTGRLIEATPKGSREGSLTSSGVPQSGRYN